MTIGLLLCAAAGVQAVSLGPNLHSATLGQPLDVSVQMTLEPGDKLQALCAQAGVFYAERQLNPSQVKLAAEPATGLQQALLRVRSAEPVDAPVVTVQLQAGCAQKTVRRYVVLAAAAQPEAQAARGSRAPELELRLLREELLKLQTELAQSRAQLESAQNQGFREETVYGVLAFLLLSFAGLLLFVRRRRTEAAVSGPGAGLLPESTLTSSAGTDSGVREWLFDSFKRTTAPAGWRWPVSLAPLARLQPSPSPVSGPWLAHSERVAALFDLQQQVAFFTSLGQQDKAIAQLRKHLAGKPRPSALVYLDLFDLYHQTGNRGEYKLLRAEFRQVFAIEPPPFESYTAVGGNVSVYEEILARIEAAWPRHAVFDILDEALFCELGNPAKVLDQAAYLDLLLLHAVIMEITDVPEASLARKAPPAAPDPTLQPPSSPRLGLDIDLNKLHNSAQPAVPAAAT